MIKHKKILVGVSGGPDSMYLTNFLENKYGKEKIIILHFNHKFRKESEKEQDCLKKYFKKKGIEIIIGKYDGKDFKEQNLRKARYEFFKKNGWGKYYLALGHNLTDRIETSFINILRGAGIKGFLNMKHIDHNKKIYRPLINLEKNSIQKKCDKNNILYFIDKTNFDSNISKRNLIRNEILPKFESIGNNFYDSFNKIYKQIEEIVPQYNIENYLTKIDEKIYELEIPKENIKYFLRELLNFFEVYDFRSGVLNEIIDYIKNSKGGGFKKYSGFFIFKKSGKIYVGENLSIKSIKEIGQNKNKN